MTLPELQKKHILTVIQLISDDLLFCFLYYTLQMPFFFLFFLFQLCVLLLLIKVLLLLLPSQGQGLLETSLPPIRDKTENVL